MTDLELKNSEASDLNSPTVIETSLVPNSHSSRPLDVLELENRLQIRSAICHYLIKALGYSTAACFGLIILQGFHPFGFQMDTGLLHWLCGATIVKSGVLLAVFTNAVWQRGNRNSRKPGKTS